MAEAAARRLDHKGRNGSTANALAQLTVASVRRLDLDATAPSDLTRRTSLARARSIGNNRQ